MRTLKKKQEIKKIKKDLEENKTETEVTKKTQTKESENQSKFVKITNTIKKIPPDRFVWLITTGASIATGNPLPSTLYSLYKAAKITKKIYDLMNNIKLREELKNLIKIYVDGMSRKVLENKTEEISKKVTEQFQHAGIIQDIATKTQYNEDSVKMLFETTLNNTIDSGIGNFTNWAVDTAL